MAVEDKEEGSASSWDRDYQTAAVHDRSQNEGDNRTQVMNDNVNDDLSGVDNFTSSA